MTIAIDTPPDLDAAPPETADAFEVWPENGAYELIDGVLVETEMDELSAWVAGDAAIMIRPDLAVDAISPPDRGCDRKCPR